MINETNEEINKRLHEIMGLCWHTVQPHCNNCAELMLREANIDFFTWTGFSILWGWLHKQERTTEFWEYKNRYYQGKSIYHEGCIPIEMVSPSALAKAVCDFFEEEVK